MIFMYLLRNASPNPAVNIDRSIVNCFCHKIIEQCNKFPEHAVTQLVEALRYMSEGRGFDPRCCLEFIGGNSKLYLSSPIFFLFLVLKMKTTRTSGTPEKIHQSIWHHITFTPPLFPQSVLIALNIAVIFL